MDRLTEAFKRQILPKELADDDRINEDTENDNTSFGEPAHSQEEKNPGLLQGIFNKVSMRKDLRKLEEDTLKKG